MKFLKKTDEKAQEYADLSYEKQSDRKEIRALLLKEQKGFCAYSERFCKQTDSANIEHFNPLLKNTPQDGYYNWYAVLDWFNEHKPKKIERFLPILSPFADDLEERIFYEDGIFKTKQLKDMEAQNLINFLGLNKPELYKDRENHVKRVKLMKSFCSSDEELLTLLQSDLEFLSFLTALEIELEMSLFHLLDKK